ncbi:MBL fold metallo-hydrolase [Psychroserpens damuponensis]|uniref:MBL fold metallo-hydrolase n=1 Tax=Psychroserpens damuponensis TaxID=943936 RepID=UPI00058DB69B|nr:MBL fold metallo-hydrolase [Psychroserpens damuponensis]
MVISIGIILGLLALIVIVFVNTSPEFGGKASPEKLAIYNTSKNYKDGKFVNTNAVNLDMSLSDIGKTLIAYFKSQPNTIPDTNISVEKIDSLHIDNYKDRTRLMWFGHSTFLLQMDQKTILIDPMFGDVPAPHPMLGSKRFSDELPITVEKLPNIDAVLISHDHYDHLDYGSIIALKDKVDVFYTPLGVGAHLEKWGINKDRIIELDWWQEATLDGVQFKCTPAQHFSGRGLTDRTKTLWCSWVIKSGTDNIFFSGDSGYSTHFKAIGDAYGPFDLAMIECGQYNEKWPDIHMFPEESVKAGIDVKAKQMMPIHWGAFKLAMHPWTDPVERVTKKAEELNVSIITPKIGDVFFLKSENSIPQQWWIK